MYLLGPSFTNIAHLLGPFLGEKMGLCLTGKNLKQKETRSKRRNCTSLLPAQEWSRGSTEIHSDTASFQSPSLVDQFSPQSFTFFLHAGEWILPRLEVCGSVAAHTDSTEVSWTPWFCRGESLLACCRVKVKFCSLQNTSNMGTFLNAF